MYGICNLYDAHFSYEELLEIIPTEVNDKIGYAN